jgi:putative ABC transport system substrate-binding protein
MTTRNDNRRKAPAGWTMLGVLLVAALLLNGCSALQAKKTYRVGVLSGLDAFAPAVEGFKTQLAQLGYVEGENIVYDIQSTNVDVEAYQSILQKFVEDDVDLIFVFPTEAAIEAKAATQGTDIPVIFDLAFTDIPELNLIDSVRKPGGNITGVRFPGTDISSRRLEILLECAPNAKRIFVPYLKDYPNVPGQLTAIRSTAADLGVTIVEYASSSPQDLQTEMDRRAASDDIGLDAILFIAEPLSLSPNFFAVIGKFAYEHYIPIGGAPMVAGDYASFFGLLPDAWDTGEQAAFLADKVLTGSRAGTIPVLSADGFLWINLQAAQALGITIPQGLLAQANLIVR